MARTSFERRAVEVEYVAEDACDRYVGGVPGSTWKVFTSGRARTSASWMRLNPSIADPSNVMPSSRAFSASAGVMLKVFGVPSTSVNQSCTKRMARSSTVLKTYSC